MLHFAVASALLSIVSAAPTTTNTTGFTVVQVESPNLVLVSGAGAVAKAHLKYNASIPDEIAAVIQSKVQKGSVKAIPEQFDRAYLSPVKIGTPAQTLMLDFDTGSSDLWVFSNLQPSAQTTGHTPFKIGQSSSAKRRPGETWDISYADGSGSKGVVYSDKVNIGGVTAVGQAVECATSVSGSFSSDKATDGLVGLGGQVRNTAQPKSVTPFFQHVAHTLPKKVFTALLKKGAPGSYDFGFINPNKHTGSIAYTPIKRTPQGAGLYQFISQGYSVGKKHFTADIDAIADTGTSLMLLPKNVVQNYYAQVNKAQYNSQVGGHIFPCKNNLPPFSLSIGGKMHTVPGSYINYVKVGSIGSVDYCYGGIQAKGNLPFGILGDVFLKSQFVVFDVGNQRLGFAPQK